MAPRKTAAPRKTVARPQAKRPQAQQIREPVSKPYEARQRGKYMSTKQLEHFRSILLKQKKELLQEANRLVEYMKSDPVSYADTIDRAVQEEEFTLQLKESNRERKLLGKIDQALVKINNRRYGFCVSCGGEIGIGRLEARPTTDQCIDCKQLDEIKEQHLYRRV